MDSELLDFSKNSLMGAMNGSQECLVVADPKHMCIGSYNPHKNSLWRHYYFPCPQRKKQRLAQDLFERVKLSLKFRVGIPNPSFLFFFYKNVMGTAKIVQSCTWLALVHAGHPCTKPGGSPEHFQM